MSVSKEEEWPEYNEGATYVDKIRTGQTIIEFYSSNYSNSASRDGWLLRLKNSQILVNGRVIRDPNHQLKEGDELTYVRLPWKEPTCPGTISAIYEDEHILLISKPSGLQVIRGGFFHQRTVVSILQNWQSNGTNIKEVASPESSKLSECEAITNNSEVAKSIPAPVHRLGRGTSGILVCAKSAMARKQLSEDFGKHSIKNAEMSRKFTKTYRALCRGIIEQDKVIVNASIGKVNYSGVYGGLYMASESGKHAHSEFRVLHRILERNETLVEVDLLTGRAHQIRIHSAFIGHPLVGDPLYAAGGVPKNEILDSLKKAESISSQEIETAKTPAKDGGRCKPEVALPGDCGYFLHAFQITLEHPISKQVMRVTAIPPIHLRMPGECEGSFLPLIVV